MAPRQKTAADKNLQDDLEPFNLKEQFPPRGSEAALMQTAKHKAKETLASIYFDLNAYSRFQRNAGLYDAHSMQVMDNLVDATVSFMEQEFANYMACVAIFQKEHGEFQSIEPDNRFFYTVYRIGWKMLAICAHTEAFRRAFRQADHRLWDFLLQNIQKNSLSIENYAHSRELDWPSLIKNAQGSTPGLPPVKDALESGFIWDIDHPHHTVLTLDEGRKRPNFKEQFQTHIDESSYKNNFEQDPTAKSKRTSRDGCHICGSHLPCECKLQSRVGELVELVEYPKTGTGVRTLTSLVSGDILGVFVGELTAQISQDDVYALTQSPDGTCGKPLCYVAPHQFGNWTRFINHSCQPSTQFVVRTIGDRVVTTIEAIRQISAFEELTIHYGDDYWRGIDRKCACGHWDCCSNPLETEGKKTRATRKA